MFIYFHWREIRDVMTGDDMDDIKKLQNMDHIADVIPICKQMENLIIGVRGYVVTRFDERVTF